MTTAKAAPTWRASLHHFLGDYLPRHRGVSPRTQESYATSLKLLLERVEAKVRHPHELTVPQVFAFLESLECERKNGIRTRNLRLVALKSFFRALRLWDPPHSRQYDSLLLIPTKRAPRSTPEHLEQHEVRALFKGVDARTRQGFRDLTILRYFYNTGSRISEVAGARISWLDLREMPEVTIRGKGGKCRTCPLWATTAELLRVYLREERGPARKGAEDVLFLTRRGGGFTRGALWKALHGHFARTIAACPSLAHKRITPHTLRHSTAVSLLRAGVEVNVIKAWLGHADVATTSRYLDLDLDKKREALERFLKLDVDRLLDVPEGGAAQLPERLLSWLERL